MVTGNTDWEKVDNVQGLPFKYLLSKFTIFNFIQL